MPYMHYKVVRDVDGWHLRAPSLGIETQLASYKTRGTALRAMSELTHFMREFAFLSEDS